jgi:molecular chaperone GrpE
MEKHKNIFVITVKAVVVNDEGKVLVLKRPEHEKSGAGKYDLPGGSIEQGEDIKPALTREITEETGLTAEIGPVIHVFDFEKGEGNEPHSTTIGKGIRFLAYYKNGEVKLDEKEHAQFEWLEINQAIEKFADKGFEKDKRDSLIKAKEYLELKNSLDGWKRCQADFENYKKRQAETQKDFIRFSTENVILQLLPILDNFHISTDHVPKEQKDTPWVVGIMHIQKQLESILTTYGVTEIKTKVGDEFNPEIHEAVANDQGTINKEQKTESKEQKNKIAKIIQRGYKMDNKVIRPARVIVE